MRLVRRSQILVARIGDDADDLELVLDALSREIHLSAERTLDAEICPGGGFVENGDTQRVRPIAGREQSSGQQADARGFEIAVGDLVDADTAILLRARDGTVDLDRHSTVPAAERVHVRYRGRRHTRHLVHPLDEAAPDRAEPGMVGAKLRRGLRRDGPPRHGGLDLHRQDAMAIEARRERVFRL